MKQYGLALFFLFFLIVGGLCIAWGENVQWIYVVALLTDLGLLTGLLWLLPKRWAVATAWLISLPLFVLAVVDVFSASHFLMKISPEMLSMLINTNAQESASFFASFGMMILTDAKMLTLFTLLFLYIAGNILIGIYHQKIASLQLSRFLPNTRLCIIIGVLLMIAGFTLSWPQKRQFARLMGQQTVADMEGLIFSAVNDNAYLPVYRFFFSLRAISLAEEEIALLRQTVATAHIDSCSHRSPLIVLVIGESYNRHHSQLYGYTLPTTPHQEARRDSAQLTVFTDVVAPWNITTNVFNQLFSLHHYGAQRPWSSYPLFPQLFRQAGYRVTFLTNQFDRFQLSRQFNQTGGFFLNDTTIFRAQFDEFNHRHKLDDGFFFYRNKELLVSSQPYRLDIIHLNGQHFDYATRYPEDHRFFTAKDYPHRPLTQEQKEEVAHYDNATRYNDEVMEDILQFYADSTAIMIYLSDHGEECYDDLPVKGRLYSELTARQVRQEFEIPFWIWCSKSYQQQYPETVNLIRAAADRPFMTDRLPHLLLYLAGIHHTDYDEQLNLISPAYNSHIARKLEGIVDYDTLMNGLNVK